MIRSSFISITKAEFHRIKPTPVRFHYYSTKDDKPPSHYYRYARPPRTSSLWPIPSLDEAVSNILYNTPRPPTRPQHRHVLNCLVTDEPGVLSRVSGILAARGFNIDSLVVSKTDVPQLSRMTIVLNGHDHSVDQAIKQLEDLVPVWAVLDYTHTKLIQREMLLIKVNLIPKSMLVKLNQDFDSTTDGGGENDSNPHPLDRPHKLSMNESDSIIRSTHDHLSAITLLARNFGAKVVDISSESAVIELCAKTERIDAFINLLHPFGLIEVARSGGMAMTRTPIQGPFQFEVEQANPSEEDDQDQANLPPS